MQDITVCGMQEIVGQTTIMNKVVSYALRFDQ